VTAVELGGLASQSGLVDGVAYELMPMRFHRFAGGRVLLTNLVGEHLFVADHELMTILSGCAAGDLLRHLRGKHLVRLPGETLPLELLALKARTRQWRLAQFTSLHLFVVTLRCDHACRYCQVSRQNSTANAQHYDMSADTAEASLDLVFKSPASAIKIEFQGGEPLLNLERIEHIAISARRRNETAGKDLAFVVASNLALVDDDVIELAREHDLHFSTSIDGARTLHNRNRPRPGGDSWERAMAGIDRIRTELGGDRVSALMTTTDLTLASASDVIDAYVGAGLYDIFLRPISPYGFARRESSKARYDVERWLAFYEEGLDRIIALNNQGVPVRERYASIVLTKILTNDDPGYVDLMSPAGIGIGALVYNYDGGVFASDEGRMLAETGDQTFRLGEVGTDSYHDIIGSDALLSPLEESFAASAPMCSDCAFEPYCGADPVYHHATTGDFLGHKATSAFCQRNMGIFELILGRFTDDPVARRVFQSWVQR